MRNTTLCYIARGRDYLMLHRVKKENDEKMDRHRRQVRGG